MAKLKIINRYATIPNELLNDSIISLKAKGMYAYIQSKSENWDFSAERISKQLKEGLPSVKSALQELEFNGYLVRRRFQNNKGFWEVEYILYENPVAGNLLSGKPTEENPIIGKPANISNKDFSNKEDNNYTNNKERVVKDKQISFYDMVTMVQSEIGDEYENFVSYWMEPDKKGKPRWESEKFFDISRRVKTWMANKNKFNNNGNTTEKLGTSAARMEALRKW